MNNVIELAAALEAAIADECAAHRRRNRNANSAESFADWKMASWALGVALVRYRSIFYAI